MSAFGGKADIGKCGRHVDQIEMCHRSAALADKILKGAKPSDIPVEQPTRLEFLINLKTAKALGLTIPVSMLATANQVVE
jgi:putative tryptophan/tyrosine transport system substrate-binding protein